MIKTMLLASAFSALLAVSAYATPGSNGGGNGGCGVGQTTNGCGPVNNYSPNLHGEQYQGQAQGQVQGQAQGQQQTAQGGRGGTGIGVGIGQGGRGGRGGQGGAGGSATGGSSTSHSTSAATANNRNVVGGQRNSQSVTWNEARNRLLAPNVYGNFAGGATSPCERNTFGIGGSGPGFGGLFQVPVSSDACWGERQATFLMQSGCQNAALAVLAGDPVRVALANNPCGGQPARRAVRAKY